ncbi:MAG: prepilin-type N-terminal cleavage/methylation domain-containing protein [Planctomycetota bacterium]|nr:prepilin-type N-terminal cleavage/methylation domain-containing protein [Planctomycetota bacterium]
MKQARIQYSRESRPTALARRRGFSLIEVVVSTFLVGLLMTSAMKSVGSATSSRRFAGETSSARMIAHELMSEILDKAYEDSDSPTFGLETGEAGGMGRMLFDDIDDYHGWTSEPPVNPDGSELINSSRFSRSVTVEFVAPNDLNSIVSTDMGVKLISVLVTVDGKLAVTLRSIRTKSWIQGPYATQLTPTNPGTSSPGNSGTNGKSGQGKGQQNRGRGSQQQGRGRFAFGDSGSQFAGIGVGIGAEPDRRNRTCSSQRRQTVVS